MRHLALVLAFFICNITHLLSQTSTVPVQGTVLDSLERPLVGATILLLQAQDSVMKGFALTDADGRFKLSAAAQVDYIAQITYIGYGTFARPLRLDAGTTAVDLGRIILNPTAYQLQELEITDSFIPIVIRNDTIQYNAGAFKTKPNSVVEDLLRKLPGVEVDEDGTIRAQGEEVQNILVDGKEFFDDDPKIASRTIPAEIVDKVEVYDKKSDFTEMTGIDDGDEQKTINLAIKAGKNKGVFGTLEGSYGSNNRFKGAANVNRFTKKMQFSVIGNGNNINEQTFSLEDYLGLMGGLDELLSGEAIDVDLIPRNLLDNSGISETYSGGLNFNYDFSPKTSLRSNYFFNRSDNITKTEALLQNALDGGIFTTNSSSQENTLLDNHRLKAKLNHKIDASQDLIFRASLGLSQNDNDLLSQSISRSAAAGFINQSERENQGRVDATNWKTKLTYRKKLDKKGRFLVVETAADGRDNSSQLKLENQNTFLGGIAPKTTNQKQENEQDNFNYNLKANYVEPIGKTKFLNFGLEHLQRYSDRSLSYFDLNDLDDYRLNEELSNQFERNFQQNIANSTFKWIQRKYDFSLGLNYQHTYLKNKNRSEESQFGTTYQHFLPNANLKYKFSDSKSLRMTYSTRIQVPAIEQIQPTIDNSDPLNILIGNPDLKPEYIHQFNFNFNNFNQFYFRSLFAGVNLQFIQNRIINFRTVDEQLRQVSTPMNGKGQWSINSFYDYDRPLSGKDLKLVFNGNITAQRGPFVINGQEDQSSVLNLEQSIQVENKYKSKVDLALGYEIGFTMTNYDKNTSFNQHFANHSVFSNFTWFINKDWTFDIDARWRLYGETDFAAAQQFTILNASINKAFLDNQLNVFIKGGNLLNVNENVRRNSFGNQVQETISNRVGAYVLVGASYKLRSFGK